MFEGQDSDRKYGAANINPHGLSEQQLNEIVKSVLDKEYGVKWVFVLLFVLSLLAATAMTCLHLEGKDLSFSFYLGKYRGGLAGLSIVLAFWCAYLARPVVNIGECTKSVQKKLENAS